MLDIPYSDPQVNPQVVKKRRLSQSIITSSPTGPSVTDATMVADARRRAFDAGIKPTTDFERATEILVQLFDHPDAPGVANQRFATLRQHPTQSVDDFAGELMRLATIAYPNLPESDRDSLILHRFITGLHDHRVTDILLLHPPNNLSSAIRQCRLYEIHHSGSKDTPFHDRKPLRPIPPPPSKPSTLPVRFPDFNPGCAYCTVFGPQAKRCGHNTPNTVSHSPPFTVPVNFEGQSVQALVDTGANVSLVNPAVLSHKTYDQIEPMSYPRSLRAANGTTIPVTAPDARNQLRELLLSFPDVFTWTTDSIGRTSKVQHTINTGDAKPVWQPPRRIPTRYRDEVDKILDELLKARIIQPSSSPWASAIALVPKKDGSLRLCIDYRRLNAVTVRDSFPLPRLDDTLDTLGSEFGVMSTSKDDEVDDTCWLVLTDVPTGTVIGLDANVWRVGRHFRGIKDIPLGLHYMFYSAVRENAVSGVRCSQFLNFTKPCIVKKRWISNQEEFQDEPEADIDREILLSKPTEVSMFLAQYPKERLADWVSLSSHVTASVVTRLEPTGRYIYSCAQFQSEKSNSQDRASVPIPDRLLRDRMDSVTPESLAECEAQLPALKTVPETDLRLTVLPAHPLYPPGASPTEISLHNMDQTYTLNALLGQIETSTAASSSTDSRGLSHAEAFLLGEFQFSFAVFLLGEVLEGWYHWRNILTLLANCEKAICEHPRLYKALITCLYRQLTFTGDEKAKEKDSEDDDSLKTSMKAAPPG
nr:unnamed protein product [Spirometra erinaceieuropaei]